MAGEGRRFRGDALHHAAIAANGINVVVEDLEARLVVAGSEPLLGNGHTDAGSDACSEGAGRSFNARDPVILGMAGGPAVELAEVADIVEGDRRFSERLIFGIDRLHLGEMEHRP